MEASSARRNRQWKRCEMGNRAESSGISITEEDAALIRGMILRGDRKHDIAAFFGVNPGRIADIESGRRFPSAPPLPRRSSRRPVPTSLRRPYGEPGLRSSGGRPAMRNETQPLLDD